MKPHFIILALLAFLTANAQIGIGTTNPQTTLDIRGSNHLGAVGETDGILVPRVNALNTNGNVDGQLVYLIADTGSFSKGFHYWDSDATSWLPVNSTIEPWNEAGTANPATLNTDNLYTLGKVGIGRTNPTGILHLQHSSNDNNLDDVMIDSYSNATTSFFGLRKARGTIDTPLNLQNGDNIGWITFVPRYNGNLGYLGSSIASFYRGTGTDNVSDLVFQTNGNQDRMRLTPEGNLGINVYNPTATLQVNGTFRYVDASPGNDAGKVLTSDADGNASWQTPNTIQEVYGEMYADIDGGSTAAGAYTRSLNTTSVLKNVIHNNVEYYLQVAVAGSYEVSFSVTIQLNNNTFRTIEFFVERAPNNNTYTKIAQSSTFLTPPVVGGRSDLKKSFLVTLNANDRIRLRYNTAVNGDFTFPSNTNGLVIKRIGS
ncbi:hypothetical protein [Leeuwenhoekiella nanhaiensis]|uniref:C1q domain-containing protein n=1 Tax=Leeuwenhoekiella nanhaiensis TaxID=1655491 RepID=A0A2G1VPT2_9FLAO|nr:hypothetical protein [Leeuwenhoekiella nanhaiensis]PHQ28777.1 hypothetical protein CJ305_13240 [Leeuwenhoekiella nanhaiensis]